MIFNKPQTQTVDNFVVQLGKSAKKAVHPERLAKINEFVDFLDLQDQDFTFMSPHGTQRICPLFCRWQKFSLNHSISRSR